MWNIYFKYSVKGKDLYVIFLRGKLSSINDYCAIGHVSTTSGTSIKEDRTTAERKQYNLYY